MACAPSEDSDQPGHPPGRTCHFVVLYIFPLVALLHRSLARSLCERTLKNEFAEDEKCLNLMNCLLSSQVGAGGEQQFLPLVRRGDLLSQFTRLWYFSSSVNSFFKRAFAAIQWD